MGFHNDIATAIATKVAAIANVQSCSPTAIDTVGSTPACVVGPPKGRFLNRGTTEAIAATFPLHAYIAQRIDNVAVDSAAINDFLDLFIVAFRAGITLGGVISGEVSLASWDADRVFSVGASEYAGIEFVLYVEAYRETATGYTA